MFHESFLKYKVWEYLRQSSLQTELSYKIRLSIIQYIMMFDNAMCLNITLQLQSSLTQLYVKKAVFILFHIW